MCLYNTCQLWRNSILSIPGLGRSPGERYGNPPQFSCLEDPMDRGASWAIIHGVTESWTRLKWLSMQHAQTLLWKMLIPIFLLYSKVALHSNLKKNNYLCSLQWISSFFLSCYPWTNGKTYWMYHMDKQYIINLVLSLRWYLLGLSDSLLQLLLLSLRRYPRVLGLVLVLGGMLAVICWSQGQFLLAEWVLLALL